ncbi:MAG: dTMP kinase [Deltaproteobacteria bacterium]|nr:dTMP kinase [Deltaproteobacteria bacterium]
MGQRGVRDDAAGVFITFEGIDGCGKTTQLKLLAHYLRERGRRVLETREPGGTDIGRALRAVLLDPANAAITPACELLLYMADRVQHLSQVIRPALARGEVVLCDRFHDATVAYQSHARGLSLDSLQGFIREDILSTSPHTTFWLDMDVGLARRRMAERAREADENAPAESRLDDAEEDFHRRVRAGYQAICKAEPQRVIRIEAGGTEQETALLIRKSLEERHEL